MILVWVLIRVVLGIFAGIVHEERDSFLLFRLRFLVFARRNRLVLLLEVGLVAIIADLLYEAQLASLICIGAELLTDRCAFQQMLVDPDRVQELVPIDQFLLQGLFAIREVLEQFSELLESVVQFSSRVDFGLWLRWNRGWLLVLLLILDVDLLQDL